MRMVLGVMATLAALGLCGCEQNPLENWAYERASSSGPEHGGPLAASPSAPASATANQATVTSAPLRSLTAP